MTAVPAHPMTVSHSSYTYTPTPKPRRIYGRSVGRPYRRGIAFRRTTATACPFGDISRSRPSSTAFVASSATSSGGLGSIFRSEGENSVNGDLNGMMKRMRSAPRHLLAIAVVGVAVLTLSGCLLDPGAVPGIVNNAERRAVEVVTTSGPVAGVASPAG